MKYLDVFKKKVAYRANKYEAELDFWKDMIAQYVDWYNGSQLLYETPCPNESQKKGGYSVEVSAILTWFELHQKEKYYKDLILEKDRFKDKKVLDVGSGPFPSALIFSDCEIFCLDPLLPEYLKIGFPMHLYENRAKFSYGYAEEMPFENNFFDAVISVNAIDHVENFEKTADEIRRVLKHSGLLRMHVHYHKPFETEPLEITDQRFIKAYKWAGNLQKISESNSKTGYSLKSIEERYVVWSNFF